MVQSHRAGIQDPDLGLGPEESTHVVKATRRGWGRKLWEGGVGEAQIL